MEMPCETCISFAICKSKYIREMYKSESYMEGVIYTKELRDDCLILNEWYTPMPYNISSRELKRVYGDYIII